MWCVIPVSGGGVLCIVVVVPSVGEDEVFVGLVVVVSDGFVGLDGLVVVVFLVGGCVGGITEVKI